MEHVNVITRQIKDNVSLTDLLRKLGFTPVRSSGKENLYRSMIRDSDNKPCFSVNDTLSVWFDHGLGIGGNVVDFGLAFWPNLSFLQVLEEIVHTNDLIMPPEIITRPQRRRVVKIPNYKIEEVKEIGNNQFISEYLQSLGIYTGALRHLKEVYYYVEDDKRQRKKFYAAGWQNELGSWEVRNQYFKGCLGHKAFTFILGNETKLSVFDGFINYLSWFTENPLATDSILVLNTITLVFAASKKAGTFKQVSVYFDQDEVSRKAAIDFMLLVPQAKDCCRYYEGHNNYNDKIISERTIRTFLR